VQIYPTYLDTVCPTNFIYTSSNFQHKLLIIQTIENCSPFYTSPQSIFFIFGLDFTNANYWDHDLAFLWRHDNSNSLHFSKTKRVDFHMYTYNWQTSLYDFHILGFTNSVGLISHVADQVLHCLLLIRAKGIIFCLSLHIMSYGVFLFLFVLCWVLRHFDSNAVTARRPANLKWMKTPETRLSCTDGQLGRT